MATIDEIKQQAEAVKNATQVGENTAERVGGALAGLADIAKAQEDNIGKKADKAAVDAELGKKFNKSEIVQTTGEAEDKVMSQKVISREFARTCNIRRDTSSADLSLGDEDGNAIVQFENGHIRTKNFDSSVKSYVENKTLYLK